MTRKRVGVRTHWWRRESDQKFRSLESTVFVGAVFETQLTLGQLKSLNTKESERWEAMFSSVHIRDKLSGGWVMVLRYVRAIIVGSVLKSSSHTIRLTQSEEGVRRGR